MQFARHIYETLLVKPFTALMYGLGFAGAATLLLSDLLVRLPAIPVQARRREQ